MANVSFAHLDQTFDDMNGGALVAYTGGTLNFHSSSIWLWTSASGNVSSFAGSGLTYDGSNVPTTGGTVTGMQLDLGNDSPLAPELAITGLSLDFGLFAHIVDGTLTADQQEDLYWRTLLAGDDTIDLGNAATTGNFHIIFNGDGRFVESGQTLFGGNDSIAGDVGGFGSAEGDFFEVLAGGSAYGGNDTLSVTGLFGVGDVSGVSGFLFGGDDMLSVQFGGFVDTLFGDAQVVNTGGTVIGGNDTILADGATTAIGDVQFVSGNLFGGNDTITGGDASDNLYGDAVEVDSGGVLRGGADTIHGGSGADSIFGDWNILDLDANVRGGNDVLFGDAGDDFIAGNGGDDQIHGGADADQMFGEDGNDTFFIDAVTDFTAGERYNGGDGTDTIHIVPTGGAGNYTLDLGTVTIASIEAIVYGDPGENGSATVQLAAIQFAGGLSLAAAISGNSFADVADTLSITMGNVTSLDLSGLIMTNFADPLDQVVITGDDDAETIIGTGGRDVISGGFGFDQLIGGGGDDILVGGLVKDLVNGGAGNDTIQVFEGEFGDDVDGGADTDTLDLGGLVTNTANVNLATGIWSTSEVFSPSLTIANVENVTGGHGNDTLTGGGGANVLNGSAGRDTLTGGDGSDTYLADVVNDIVTETNASLAAGGNDLVNFAGAAGTFVLSANVERLTLTHATANTNGTGNALANAMSGNAGNNVLSGLAGADTLTGNGGTDTLIGGTGIDTLRGGTGKDFFVFNAPLAAANRDVVLDFSHVDDTFRLENAVMQALGTHTGALNASFFFVGAAAHDADDHIIYNKATGALSYDANGNLAGGVTLLAMLTTKPTVLANDFTVI